MHIKDAIMGVMYYILLQHLYHTHTHTRTHTHAHTAVNMRTRDIRLMLTYTYIGPQCKTLQLQAYILFYMKLSQQSHYTTITIC